MGFYPPASLVRDGQRRGVEVLPPDVNLSDAQLRDPATARVRVGLGYVRTVGEAEAQGGRRRARRAAVRGRRATSRSARPSAGRPADGARRARARATRSAGRGASCSGSSASSRAPQSVAGSGGEERQLALPLEPTARDARAARADRLGADARRLRRHDASRSASTRWSCCARTCPTARVASRELPTLRHGSRVAVAGMVVARQRPSTANGVVFMLLEDEHGQINLIVPPPVYERHRATRPRRAAAARPRHASSTSAATATWSCGSSRRSARSPADLRRGERRGGAAATRTTSAPVDPNGQYVLAVRS